MDRTRTALVCTVLGLVGTCVSSAVALPAPAHEQLFFTGHGGHVACAVDPGSPTPGTVPQLAVTQVGAFAGVQYDCPGCVGSAPATPPSFWFNSDVAGAATLGSPRLVIAFDDGGSIYLRPSVWTGDWQLVDGTGNDWVSTGGSCGLLADISYTKALACHSGRAVLSTYVVTDAGQAATPYRHLIDDVIIGATTFSGCMLAAGLDEFRAVRRGAQITVDSDKGGTDHLAVNFRGTAGAAGDTWITVFDQTPEDAEPTIVVGSVSLSADVLIAAFNNKKGAGVLALYSGAPGKKGLALTISDSGKTDTLVLSTVDQVGQLKPLKTVSLGAGISENVWYRVAMDATISGSAITVSGTVRRHQHRSHPESPLAEQIGGALTYSGTLGSGALAGVDGWGQVGIIATATSAAVDSSVTNFLIDPASGDSAPPLEIIFD